MRAKQKLYKINSYFQKNENNYIFFRRKLPKLHEKGTLLHVIITFFWNKGKIEQAMQLTHYSALSVYFLL